MSSILGIRGPLTGAKINLNEGENFLGRATSNLVTITDSTVSRTHAVIRSHRLAWLLEDCGSSGGTYLNGRKVTEATPLKANDEVKLGQSIFLFDSDFDLQNADFSDKMVFFSGPLDETVTLKPVATLSDDSDDSIPIFDPPSRHGMELLTELGQLFDSTRTPFGESLRATTSRMARMLRSDVALLLLQDNSANQLRVSVALAEEKVLADRSVIQRVYTDRKAVLISDKPELHKHPSPDSPEAIKARSIVSAPITVDDAVLGVLFFERHELDAYTLKDLELVQSLGKLMGIFIEARQKAEALIRKVNFHQSESAVIGGSAKFKKVLEVVRRVAETSATVLLHGETGTGKEVLAEEIHRLSPQGKNERPFIALNCAAIPETLFESELFGHEKGAFTGAHKLRQGYIEQATGGTLFLDEIGELSLSLQPKILRFLQEHTFTRVGGNRLLRAEVRIITATNRNLVQEVEEGRFREDLYHRLNVMQIHIPPLRERREDIRPLVEHFISRYGPSLKKEVVGVSDQAMIQLEKYNWPGNIRELANCVERAILLCDDSVLMPRDFTFPKHPSSSTVADQPTRHDPVVISSEDSGETPPRPLADVEKEHILKILEYTDRNQVKAAEILGIHRNTLRKKLQEYGEITS